MNLYPKLSAIAIAASLAGCAVPNSVVNKASDDTLEKASQAVRDTVKQKPLASKVVRVSGNYVAGSPTELDVRHTLPDKYKNVVFHYSPVNSLQILASNLTKDLKIPVDLHPDVITMFTRATPSMAGGQGVNGVPQSNIIPASGNTAQPLTTQFTPSGLVQLKIDMDFEGDLANYLDTLCSRFGLSWEYVNGRINLFRVATRTYQLKASAGAVDFSSTISKGSNATTGGNSANSNQQSTGTFNAASTTGVSSMGVSSSKSLLDAITAMLTPSLGKVVSNDSTGSIIVTDAPMVLDRIEKLVNHENEILLREVALQIDSYSVQIDDASQFGFDISMIYKSLSNGWSAAVNPVAQLTDSSVSSVTYNVLSGDATNYPKSTFVAQALNAYGRVSKNEGVTLNGSNRVPMPLAAFATKGYLAGTTAATGGSTAAGTGVPGLIQGSITTGLFVSVVPTILDNQSVILRMSFDTSTLLGIDTIGTGSGATLQQIQTPNTSGRKSDHNVTLKHGDALILVGLDTQLVNGKTNNGALSAFLNNSTSRTIQVVVVTPYIHSSL
jgi:type IVB pilus formation R64 PilN family outer membrane protein